MTALGVLVLMTLSAGAGWWLCRRRPTVADAALRRELDMTRRELACAKTKHEAILRELTTSALRVMRGEGGGRR